jgi:hypothetical protein
MYYCTLLALPAMVVFYLIFRHVPSRRRRRIRSIQESIDERELGT